MCIYVHSHTIHNCQTMKWAKLSINRWIDYKAMGNVHNGVLHSHKEGQHDVIYREMDGTGEYFAKWD